MARIIKEYCSKAGLDPAHFSGHTLRAGGASAARENGAFLQDIMLKGRWKSADAARQ